MAIGKQSQAQKILEGMRSAGENVDPEDIISKTIALTSPNADPRLHPANSKLAYADRGERFSLAREILVGIAYPKTPPPSEAHKLNRSVVINIDPTAEKSEKWEEADEKTKKFRGNVAKAGYINLDKADQEHLDNQGLLPQKLQGSEITSALNLYARGAKSSELAAQAEAGSNLGQGERDYLLRTAYFVACFEEANLKAELPSSELLHAANLSPEVTSIDVYSGGIQPDDNQFVLVSDGETMTPLIPYESQPGQAIVDIQGNLKDMAFNAIEKGGKKLVNKELKSLEKAGLKQLEKVAGKEFAGIAAKAGVKAAVKGSIMAAAEAAGTTVPIVGNIIAWIAVEVGDKLLTVATKQLGRIKRWLEDNKEVVFGFGLLALVGGLLTGFMPLALLGVGSLLLVGAPLAGVVSGAVIGVGTIIVVAFAQAIAGIGAAFVYFVTALMVILVTFYIITVGGYMVPYWGNDAYSNLNVNQENPYIGVGKVANPSKAPNPTSVTYTITITAKRGNLTNVRITNYTCTVTKKDKSKVDCPPDQPPPISADVVVGVSTAYSFTYTINYGTYGTRYKDALIVDTITITADTPTQAGVSSSSSAGVCFGDCPEDCPSDWPVGPQSGETQLQVTQGPYSNYSHTVLDGIDITNMDAAGDYQSMNGHTIRATHSGLFCAPPGEVDRYGNVVYIVGSCNGTQFATVYAHILPGSAMITSGQKVTKGQSIALTDDTGGWNFPHLHYEFAEAGGDGTSCSGFYAQPKGKIPNMQPPYVPKPIGSCFWNCGVTIP